jgi:hypothetical protein
MTNQPDHDYKDWDLDVYQEDGEPMHHALNPLMVKAPKAQNFLYGKFSCSELELKRMQGVSEKHRVVAVLNPSNRQVQLHMVSDRALEWAKPHVATSGDTYYVVSFTR